MESASHLIWGMVLGGLDLVSSYIGKSKRLWFHLLSVYCFLSFRISYQTFICL